MARRPLPPARDRRAVLHPAPAGRARLGEPRHVVVVGGGIAGLGAATVLAERGAQVTLVESEPQLGGRVRAWPLGDGRTMSRGFHAFFRQYYTLRSLLRRADPTLTHLVPVADYPLQRGDGLTDSFASLPPTPPWNLMTFVAQSPTFPISALPSVDLPSAIELISTHYPDSHERYDGESAQAFLDRLRFPTGARHLALEVFARSFFAHPDEFSAGELVAMFHCYFTGSSEGLLFDVPDDDYDTALWAPWGRYLTSAGVRMRVGERVERVVAPSSSHGRWQVETSSGALDADAVVLAADPRTTRQLLADLSGVDLSGADAAWSARAAAGRNAPPFGVLRLWLDRPVAADRPAFLGTSGYDLLDNVSVLERFEAGAARWSSEHGGSVVELHGYALDPTLTADEVRRRLLASLAEIWPETADAGIVHEQLLIEDDCALVGTGPWRDRLTVETPHDGLVLAGDHLRLDAPVALMERAAVTGVQAANHLLAGWGVRGEQFWTVPMAGLLRGGRLPTRPTWARAARAARGARQ